MTSEPERRLERARARVHDEYAVELDFELPWSTGAPLPHLIANGHQTYLMFYLDQPDPDWDGTWTRVVDPGSPDAEPLGVVAHVTSPRAILSDLVGRLLR